MVKRGETVRLATRGSDLAMRQATQVKEALSSRRLDVELVEIETRGDRIRDELIHELGTTGAFVRTLDERVLDGEVDGAVHSMKDVPTEVPDDLVVAAIPERAPAGDLLVTPDGRSLDDLPEGAAVGTASLRRQAQLLHERPDLEVEGLRGNVDTRIEKLLAPGLQREHERRIDDAAEGTADEDDEFEQDVEEWFDGLREIERRAMEREVDVEYDAIVLAAAGLERTGLVHQVGTQELSTEQFVPSPGQGALAITMRDGDLADRVNDTLDDPRTRVETALERAVLAELGGGCVAPLGVHAVIQGEYVHCVAQVFSRDGREVVAETRDLPVERHVRAAREFAADLADRGAAELVQAAKREAPDAAKRGDDDE
ncbi:hydroxymethylbilane synthase [Halobacteriales archaeon QS_1_68_20]|nr:MAG: hydroxymethylbilane synthase [Halobacteriales archaeon QS_1_68_20]